MCDDPGPHLPKVVQGVLVRLEHVQGAPGAPGEHDLQEPGAPNSFAKFKHFDANRDGYISVEEHEGYYIDRGWL